MSVSLGHILLLAFILLVATFAVGTIPVYYMGQTSENSHQNSNYIYLLSQVGIGMLLGTSFMLVIPEGIKACLEHDGNIGLNLLIGFLGVYVLDRIVQVIMKNRSNDDVGIINQTYSVKDLIRHPSIPVLSIIKNNIVFALFIHGLSDGVALGTTTGNNSLLIVLLIAIIIHKIPATLSLTSLMLSKQRLPKWQVLSNLFAFAASTPLGYILIASFNLSDSQKMETISGNLLLMSGGSLLYASFTAFVSDDHDHLNIEDSKQDPLDVEGFNNHGSEGSVLNNTNFDEIPDSATFANTPKLKYDEAVYVMAGVIVPVIISFIIEE